MIMRQLSTSRMQSTLARNCILLALLNTLHVLSQDSSQPVPVQVVLGMNAFYSPVLLRMSCARAAVQREMMEKGGRTNQADNHHCHPDGHALNPCLLCAPRRRRRS